MIDIHPLSSFRPGLRLGIDLGGTCVKLALVDEHGRIRALKKLDTPPAPRAITPALRKILRSWVKRSLLGTGVGVAGDVNPVSGTVLFAPNLKWRNVPLKRYLRAAGVPEPIFFDNDATAAAWGAFHVELPGRSQNFVLLTLGTGVGGGLVLNGRLYHGATASAGELGHMVIDRNGPPCCCGSRGCLETYLGGNYLVAWVEGEMNRLGRKPPADLSPKTIAQRAAQGDKICLSAWRRAGEALGTALSNLINIFNPDTILLTGGVAAAAPLFLPHARRVVARNRFVSAPKVVRLRVSTNHRHLGVIGAALLVE